MPARQPVQEILRRRQKLGRASLQLQFLRCLRIQEMMCLLSETPELELTFNDDESVLLRWKKHEAGEWLTETHIEPEEAAPF